jgi:predicted DNA-binding protein (UPF0278 family)
MNSSILISFYDENIYLPIYDSFNTFQIALADSFSLSKTDISELIMFFIYGELKYNIENEKDYNNAIAYFKKGILQKVPMKFELEVSEKSKLFQAQLTTSKEKINEVKNVPAEEIKVKHDQIKKEILEKEKQLKELLEKEKDKNEKSQKEKLEK